MTQLVKASQKKAAPIWLQYLIGAYPHQKITAVTLGIMESQLAEYDDDVMLETVKAHVANSRFFPAVSELKESYGTLPMPLMEWHRDVYAPKHWTLCPGPCGELTPDVGACPFCADMAVVT